MKDKVILYRFFFIYLHFFTTILVCFCFYKIGENHNYRKYKGVLKNCRPDEETLSFQNSDVWPFCQILAIWFN